MYPVPRTAYEEAQNRAGGTYVSAVPVPPRRPSTPERVMETRQAPASAAQAAADQAAASQAATQDRETGDGTAQSPFVV